MRSVTLRTTITAILAAVTVGQLSARQLTPEEASQRALRFTAERSGGGMSRSSAAADLKLAYTAKSISPEQMPAFYVFNRGEGDNSGFIIASGDDRLRPVFAITDSGTFDADNLPPALKWLLGQYEDEIASYLATPRRVTAQTATLAAAGLATAPALTAAPRAATTSAENYASWEQIEPLLPTKWNQGEPYSDDCPVYNGEHIVTGCVATAFAQIVNYYKYADLSKHKGETLSYTTGSLQLPVSYTFPAKFDFANMLDEYTFSWENGQRVPDYSSAQAAAVADLMKACGVIVEMNYAPGGSAAYTTLVPEKAVEYFGYDPTSFSLSRDGIQTPEWEKSVYTELSCGRPVIYSGFATGGGHAFVCDGYLYDGLFHINWGWGGMSDGYFSLSTLKPSEQGIGSFEGGYNGSQSIHSLIRPDDPRKPETPEIDFEITLRENPSYENIKGYDYIRMGWSLTSTPVEMADGAVGVVLTDLDGKMISVVAESKFSQLKQYYGWPSQSLTLNFENVSLSKGEYYLVCSFKIDGVKDWQPMSPAKGGVNKMLFVVDANGNRSFKELEPPAPEFYPELELCSYTPSDDLYADDPLNASIIISNTGTGDYSGCLAGVYSTGSTQKAFIISRSVIIAAGQSFSLATTASLNGMTPGTYTFRAGTINADILYGENFDANNINIADVDMIDGSFEVTVKAGSAPGAQLPDVPIKVTSAANMRREYLPGDELLCPITLSSATGGNLQLTAKVIDPSTGKDVYSFYPYYFNLTARAGETNYGQFGFDYLPADIAPGQYLFVLYSIENSELTQISVQVPISVGATVNDISYTFNLDGSGVKATAIHDTSAKEIVIPASITIGTKEYPVTAIADGLFASNKVVELIDIPASVATIGVNAFSHTSNLKHTFFRSNNNPLPKPVIAFYLSNPDLKVYVPGDAVTEYASFETVGRVYAAITSLNAQETNITLDAGKSKTVAIVTAPAADTDPEFVVTVSSDCAKASLTNSILTITGVKDGKAVVTITSAQPGVKSLNINVTVGEGTVDPENPDDPYDLDGDGVVDVTDVVSLVSKMLKHTTDPALHDFDGDGLVDVSDIVMMVGRILKSNTIKPGRSRSADAAEVPVSFAMNGDYTAMQTDIVVADGARIEDVTLNAALARTHTLAYSALAPDRYRVIVYSLTNRIMDADADEPLFSLAMTGDTRIETEATIFVEAHPVPTSIDAVGDDAAAVESVTYFDFQGRQVSPESKGILIERTFLTDGRVLTRKIRR